MDTAPYPSLKLVEGRGFDHEIIDANGEAYTPLARVYAHDPDASLRLAQLFVAAPKLWAACQMACQLLTSSADFADSYVVEKLCEALKAVKGDS